MAVAEIDRDQLHGRRTVRFQAQAQDHRLAGLAGAVVEDEVAQAVGDETSVVELQTLEHVGVVAQDHVGARVDHLVGQSPLVGVRVGVVLHAPVEADHHPAGPPLGRADVGQEAGEILSSGVDAGPVRPGQPTGRLDDAEREEGHAAAGGFQQGGLAGGGQILAGARRRHPGPVEAGDGVEQGFGAPIALVVVGQADHVDAGGAEARHQRRTAAQGDVLLGVPRPLVRQGGLQVDEGQVRVPEEGSHRREHGRAAAGVDELAHLPIADDVPARGQAEGAPCDRGWPRVGGVRRALLPQARWWSGRSEGTARRRRAPPRTIPALPPPARVSTASLAKVKPITMEAARSSTQSEKRTRRACRSLRARVRSSRVTRL